MKYFLDDEGSSNIYGYRPTGYFNTPRVITVYHPPPYLTQNRRRSSCCRAAKRNKFKRLTNKEQPEVIEVLGPSSGYTDASSYILETSPTSSLEKPTRCFSIQCKPSQNRNVSVQKLILTEQRSNQYPSNQLYEPNLEHVCRRSVTVAEHAPKVKMEVQAAVQTDAPQDTETRMIINGQFPCPCLCPGDTCNADMYPWRSAQSAKDGEYAAKR